MFAWKRVFVLFNCFSNEFGFVFHFSLSQITLAQLSVFPLVSIQYQRDFTELQSQNDSLAAERMALKQVHWCPFVYSAHAASNMKIPCTAVRNFALTHLNKNSGNVYEVQRSCGIDNYVFVNLHPKLLLSAKKVKCNINFCHISMDQKLYVYHEPKLQSGCKCLYSIQHHK